MANGPVDAPWHTLIEADNYHALQLLEYLYAAQVDCIYIDPPHNTGARDWKYNNDYVDGNDGWRHSKWLSMMQRDCRLRGGALNPRSSVLIVTVRPMFPDLVVVRRKGPSFEVDILEPHDPSLADNFEKAVGLARFAQKHGALFGRIQLIRKQSNAGGEHYARLDINQAATIKRLLP